MEDIVNCLSRALYEFQKKRGNVIENDSLEAQKCANYRILVKQVFDNLIRKIEVLPHLINHIANRTLHELPISCKNANLLYVLYESELTKDLLNVIQEVLQDPSWGNPSTMELNQFNESYRPLLSTLEKLKEIMECKLRLTDKEDYLKRQMLQEMSEENSKVEKKIGDLRGEIVEGQSRFDVAFQNKIKIIEDQRLYQANFKEQLRFQLNKEMVQTDIKMKEICADCNAKNAAIKKELEAVETQLSAVLKENLEKEQIIRKEKLAAQVNLKNWINKYDREVGDRTTTVRELNAIYKREQMYLEQLEEAYAKQEVQYNALMSEKETEAKRMQEERMLLFMMNRAARIIQHNWRMVLAKRKPKKKRKGKKK